MTYFKDLGLSEETLKVIYKKGFEKPTQIQEQAIPLILDTDIDIVGQAQTGTGKTAAFGLPLIELIEDNSKNIQVLILAPTRELAIQVAEEINSFKGNRNFRITSIYGGQSINIQLKNLKKGVDIVVGTPGRILDHLRRKTLNIQHVSFLVLDEADEMLNMGFLEDVTEIIKHTGSDKRTLLFSATMPDEIMNIAKNYMNEYSLVRASKEKLTVSQTDQIYFEVAESDKFEALCRIIDIEEDFYGLVFCRTKNDVDKISDHLSRRGYDADALHGDMSQNVRNNVLSRFKNKKINALVATDVAARGIDVQGLTHVINYSLPNDPESYVHRIGRTGRAGQDGIAITFVTAQEYRKLQFIIRKAKTDIRKGKLPDIRELISAKKDRIKADLDDIIKGGILDQYNKFADELLESEGSSELLAALLQYTFDDELNESSYAGIDTSVVDSKGKTRLFVNQGKKDGLTPRKLVEFIRNITGVKSNKLKDLEILDKFSFVTMPFYEAEQLLSYLKKKKGKKSDMRIEKAKVK